jgi:ficolin
VYSIQPAASPAPFQAFCDMTNGGWTVIQRRVDDSVDFYRGWADYVTGFGDMCGNWWAGLENIHAMTSCGSAELWVTMESFEGENAEARYSMFHVGDAASGYVLSVAGYSGTAGDSLMQRSNQQKFSTYDYDQDGQSYGNCAIKNTGAFWYGNCHFANPNGRYLHGHTELMGQGVVWYLFKGYYYSLKTIEFKMRCA